MRIFLFVLNCSLGISIFLLGLKLLGSTLEKMLVHRLRRILTKLTATKGRSFAVGLIVTSLIQSSSAVCSTMVVLVDSGALGLHQALGVMLGANIGTTLTAQIVAFPLEKVAIPLIIMGLVVVYWGKRRSVGSVLCSLGAVFFGLTFTTAVLAPVLTKPALQRLILGLSNTPLQAVALGALLTAVVQSSSAVTGLVIGLTKHSFLPVQVAVALALGSNVGTVLTTLLASLGRSRASKASAYADLFFNLGGVLLVLPVYPAFLRLIQLLSADPSRQVAHAHSTFNVLTALLVLPFLEYLAALAWWWAGIRQVNKNK
ncbi:MAG: Na/Pi cotransporter family protein [Firmicutes bacterium]|nr:Na/Pi cotransporter family protein [Bacillota bacterium]